jgi:hypothetical protein
MPIADAAQALDDLDLDGAEDFDYDVSLDESPPPKEDLDVDAALAELKRRMAQEG